MKGFFNKVLHIDLTHKKDWVEELKDELLSSWMGGRGLGSYLLWKYLPPGINPLSPENVLILALGAASGSNLVGSSRYGVYSKSPLTSFYADSYSGGHLAPQMKATGYDALVITGASPEPVFLEISDQEIHYHQAKSLWGKDTYATEDEVLKIVGIPKAQALVIGPAGENLVRFASIGNNYWRCAGRTGMGAVMGSKKLKAIVFHGQKKSSFHDEELLEGIIKDLREQGGREAIVQNYRKFGTPMMVAIANTLGVFPSEYWSKGSLKGWERISAEALLKDFKVRPKACFHCFFACGNLIEVLEGRHKGLKIEGPEYETIFAFGGLCKILDLAEIAYLNDLCDRFGMDTITAGNLVSFCMELSQRGRLADEIAYGDADQAANLLGEIVQRKGLGEVLSQGIKIASKEFKAEDLAIQVKGLEPAGYDPRVLKGMGLAYATSPRGACHLATTFYKAELSGISDPSRVEGKAKLLVEWEDRLTIMDTLILCRFYRDMLPWETLRKIIKALSGLDMDQKAMRSLANRITNLRHLINLREGWTKEDDFLPQRFFKEPRKDDGKVVSKEEFLFLLEEYYQLRGWDEKGRFKEPLEYLEIGN